MNFELNDEQQAYASSARQFADGVFKPNAARWDAEHIFPKDALRQAGELGFMGMYTPEEAGGFGGLGCLSFGNVKHFRQLWSRLPTTV